MANAQPPSEIALNMDTEIATHKQSSEQPLDAKTSTEIAAKIHELMKQSGIDENANPMAAQKIQRDLDYQRQIEQLPQPESSPELVEPTTTGLDRLDRLQQELQDAKAEASRWKKEFGRREGKVGGMEARIKELEERIVQVQPPVDVRQITGREPQDYLTAQDAVNLLMSQSGAFGNAIRALEERLSQAANQQEPGLPLDMEAELVDAHPWLTDLPRPQKLRAMHDILSSAGVTVTPPPVAGVQAKPTATLPEAARAQVRQAAFIEPSNKGSAAERTAVAPERQAFNDKVKQLEDVLRGPYKPGVSNKAAELLASLGAGPMDESAESFVSRRR